MKRPLGTGTLDTNLESRLIMQSQQEWEILSGQQTDALWETVY